LNSQIITHINICWGKPDVLQFICAHAQSLNESHFPGQSVSPTRQTCRPPSLISAGWERLHLLASVESFITLDLFNTAQPLTGNSGQPIHVLLLLMRTWGNPRQTQSHTKDIPLLHQTHSISGCSACVANKAVNCPVWTAFVYIIH